MKIADQAVPSDPFDIVNVDFQPEKCLKENSASSFQDLSKSVSNFVVEKSDSPQDLRDVKDAKAKSEVVQPKVLNNKNTNL